MLADDLKLIDSVLASIRMTREDHIKVSEAIKRIKEALESKEVEK